MGSQQADCLVPSCSQEDWYLRSVEADADRAFRMFGKETSDFRNCSLHTQTLPCAENDAQFATSDLTEAALAALLNLDAVELEATAWEVAQELKASEGSTAAFMQVSEATSRGESERKLFSRRSVASRQSSLDSATNGKRRF